MPAQNGIQDKIGERGTVQGGREISGYVCTVSSVVLLEGVTPMLPTHPLTI